MFADTDQQAKIVSDPVAPATRSKATLAKVARHTLGDDTPAHSFAILMAELATIVRNIRPTAMVARDATTFDAHATANSEQQRAIEVLQQFIL